MNNVTLSGRLTKDPECKEFDGGKAVCDFTIAVNGYKKEDTLYIKVKSWDGRARSCSKYCKKGSLINVCGALRENTWKDKEGNNRRELYVLASDVEFVQKPQEESSQPQEQKAEVQNSEPKAVSTQEVSEEDFEAVPF
jgi:single-strand DNA-binding protein|tara:strand:+ start:38006 stop:38419 length:414 start_codon:yes stop_codon:yes gene_type:complete